jgi:hypothetical protein
MLELRLRQVNADQWFRYQLDPNYQFGEVEAYIEQQSRMEQVVRLQTVSKRPVDFTPHTTLLVQLLCL